MEITASHHVETSRPSERIPTIVGLTFAGGFCGMYGVVFCGHVFACGQTGNLLALLNLNAGASPFEIFLRVCMILLFQAGISATVLLPDRLSGTKKSWRQLIVGMEAICILIAMLIPSDANYLLKVAPIFFAAAMQYNTFRECAGVPVATVFCANNLRQVSISFWAWRKGDEKALHRLRIYLLLIAVYSVGAVCCCLSVERWGQTAFLPVLLIYLVLTIYLKNDT
jgi:uncharacterized membrane protein YoaK (UPF0700 family)